MSATRDADRRQKLLIFALLALISGLPNVGLAVWHLIRRDDLWGLAVAWFGANGIGLLWLGDWLWRRSARYRPPDELDHQAS